MTEQPTDHYFTAKLTDAQGKPIDPPGRFRTLQGALLFAEDLDGEIDGTLYYVENQGTLPQPVIRYIKGVPEDVPA